MDSESAFSESVNDFQKSFVKAKIAFFGHRLTLIRSKQGIRKDVRNPENNTAFAIGKAKIKYKICNSESSSWSTGKNLTVDSSQL
jgi:hypothetical protein